jgi:uncharacterized protein YjbI with pentapeptide repeats
MNFTFRISKKKRADAYALKKLRSGDVEWWNSNQSDVDISGQNLRNVKLDGIDLTGRSERNCSHIDFTGASLVGARLDGDFSRCRFHRANLSGATMSGNHAYSEFTGANLSCAYLGGKFHGVIGNGKELMRWPIPIANEHYPDNALILTYSADSIYIVDVDYMEGYCDEGYQYGTEDFLLYRDFGKNHMVTEGMSDAIRRILTDYPATKSLFTDSEKRNAYPPVDDVFKLLERFGPCPSLYEISKIVDCIFWGDMGFEGRFELFERSGDQLAFLTKVMELDLGPKKLFGVYEELCKKYEERINEFTTRNLEYVAYHYAKSVDWKRVSWAEATDDVLRFSSRGCQKEVLHAITSSKIRDWFSLEKDERIRIIQKFKGNRPFWEEMLRYRIYTHEHMNEFLEHGSEGYAGCEHEILEKWSRDIKNIPEVR